MQLRLVVEYDGTAFEGWQLQPGGRTVQGELERAFGVALRTAVRVRGAGRTDAGVHAAGQVAAIRLAAPIDDLGRLRTSVNAILPDDVAVASLVPADDAFDPRRDATSRLYEYRIWRDAAPSPFWRRFAWHLHGALDVTAMREAAAAVSGTHDFRAFRARDADPVRSTVRRVLESRLDEGERVLVYRIEANAFLKHMVRTLVGTLVEIGRSKRSAGEMAELLQRGDRRDAGATAPALGLVLKTVRYDAPTSAP